MLPVAFYTLSTFILAGPMRGTTLKFDDIKMRLAKDEQLHNLAVKWIIAVEKAKRQWPMSKSARVVFRWISYKKAEDGTWKFELAKKEPVSVTQSNNDELVLWIDGHDSRWYLPVARA